MGLAQKSLAYIEPDAYLLMEAQSLRSQSWQPQSAAVLLRDVSIDLGAHGLSLQFSHPTP